MSSHRPITGIVLMIACLSFLLVGCGAADDLPPPPLELNDTTTETDSFLVQVPEELTPITAPAVIDRPGAYLLTNDLSQSGAETAIWIQSSDVFLDGGGHHLGGVLSLNATGVLAENISETLHNVTITNLSVTGWASGIGITGVESAMLREIRTIGNQDGIDIGESAGITVLDCTVTDNIPLEDGGVFFGGTGIEVSDSPGTRILNTNVSHNGWGEELPAVGGYGILSTNNTGLLVSGCSVDRNVNTGIWNEYAKDTQVLGSQFHNNGGNGGIFMTAPTGDPVMNATISDNTISGSGWGIWVMRNDYLVQNNTVSGCGYGILLDMSRNATLTGNVMHDNELNFGVDGNEYEHFLHQVDTSNTVNGRPVYYLVDQSGAIVDSATGAGTVYGISCPDLIIRDLSLENNLNGVFLFASDRVAITNVTATENTIGFFIRESDDARIEMSAASDNTHSGFSIEASDGLQITGLEAVRNVGGMEEGTGIYAENCRDIFLQQVNASDNNFAGIDVEDSEQVYLVDVTADANNVVGLILGGDTIQVTGCYIRGNGGPGIGMLDSTNATCWNNYFLNEENVDLSQGVVTGSSWNISKAPGPNIVNGPFFGGNYWAKPDGTGWSQITPDRGDGFCNAPLVLDGGNTDLLPLVYYPDPDPVANFTAAPSSGYSPLTVRFQDESTGNITGWHWLFGDGQTSDLQHPTHQYWTVGRYSVTLNVTGPTGQSELTRPDIISVRKPVSDGDDGGFAAMSYDETGYLVTSSQGTVLAEVEVEAGDNIGKLVISKGVVARDGDGEPLSEVTITPSGAPTPDAGANFVFSGYAYTCGPAGATFSPDIALVFSFTEEEWAVLMADGQPLMVMYYNETTGAYEGVSTSVNSVKRTVTAHVTHFSVFALMHTTTQAETPVPSTVVPATVPTAAPATPLITPSSTPLVPTATAAGADFPVVGVLIVIALLAIAGGNVFRRR
ncbi:NosD domain-containing protein [Methanogenium sp. MK-MG]|uniref:NosD domain-containing protein n=1 Tax=Methanogenium sp. MK-MG TaxID=2599926 RepID=UPI0013ED768C|nr:NosD domain-containing protein [Methanogenium sp. MK-MG]KAF1078044.1 hypothetical protein MKMG_01019 [Methanogenium sp. MK-MG]